MLQQPPFAAPEQNFHFVGLTNNFVPISPSPPPTAKEQSTLHVSSDIDGDNGVETSRTAKRRHWSHEEEVRLVIVSFLLF